MKDSQNLNFQMANNQFKKVEKTQWASETVSTMALKANEVPLKNLGFNQVMNRLASKF